MPRVAMPGAAREGPCPPCLLPTSTGDGHVGFKDFLAVMTDTKRFFCSVGEQGWTRAVRAGGGNRWVGWGANGNGSHHPISPEQNALTAPPNPHTLLFEILSLVVEMLALPEAALEEITKWVGLVVGRWRAGDTEIAPSVLAPVHLFF